MYFFNANPHWNEKRLPLEDENQELRRIDRYWKWLAGKKPESTQPKPLISIKNYSLVKIETCDEADYEAFYLKHSVGFSWLKYSSIGEIFSIRTAGNIPVATLLVDKKAVIHARGKDNEPINDNNFKVVILLAKKIGWQVSERQNL